MMKSKSLMIAFVVTAAASGCSKGSDSASVALDQPATVRASGAMPQSQVTLYRLGVTDSTQALTTVQIRDANVKVFASGDRAILQELTLELADSDMAATDTLPNGVRLRNQQLRLTGWLPATVSQREPDALAVQAHGSLEYSGDLINSDGSLTKIGPVESDASDLDFHATRYEFGVKVTIDTTPQGKCWSVPSVLEVSNCSLFVDMQGDAVNP
jgi:hypothetical protein